MLVKPRKPKKGSYTEFKQEKERERALLLRQQNNALSRYLLAKDRLFPGQSLTGYAAIIWNEIKQLQYTLADLHKHPTNEELADKAIELLTQIHEIILITDVMQS